ncbi:MAG TPA: hypothetical protein VN033_09530, partial [Vulgatibacter sp.]|nr:hypothetical protein [Vulgatibacter sp.]
MPAPTRDPRGRLFRRIFLGLHVSVAAVFGLSLTWGVWQGLVRIRPLKAQPKLEVSACADELSGLRQELVARLARFPAAESAAQEGRRYEEWAVEFRHRVASARQRCSPPQGATREQARATNDAF